jgi:hypothetical protein
VDVGAAEAGSTPRRAAEQWIERHEAGIAMGLPQRIRFNNRPKS